MPPMTAPTCGRNPEMFWLDEKGNPLKVSGVPPDYFSATGQLWGNPLYRWDAMKKDGYRWWIERLRASLKMFDMVRLDHFRGFEAYWEIPAGEPTAMNGKWVKGPGAELFQVLTDKLGSASDCRREPGRDHAGSGSHPQAIWLSGNGDSAICVQH